MLKKSAIRRIIISSLSLIILTIICLIPTKPNNIKKDIVYESTNTVSLYLLDKNSYVSRVDINTNNYEIKEIIEILTINSKYKYLIPQGFKAIIPENTRLIDYHIKDKILFLNFSEQFLNIAPKDENSLIEILTYSLCELKEIKGIEIYVNGSKLTTLPHSQKTLPPILNYEYGINKSFLINNLKNTNQVTIYYPSKYLDTEYYIPITKINNQNTPKVEIIVNELKTTPFINANISSILKASYELENYEILEKSIKLTFNNVILANLDDNSIEEELKYVLSLSIRDTYGIEDINIDIN